MPKLHSPVNEWTHFKNNNLWGNVIEVYFVEKLTFYLVLNQLMVIQMYITTILVRIINYYCTAVK